MTHRSPPETFEHRSVFDPELLLKVADALPTSIACVGPDRRYRFMNASYARWFEVDREQALGRRLEDVLAPWAVRAQRPHLEAALSGERVSFVSEAPYGPAGGAPRYVRATYEPLRDASGRPDGFLAQMTDVTSEKDAERRLEALVKASDLLSSSLDFERTLKALTRLCVPELADWCAVDLLRGGEVQQLAVAHRSGEVGRAAELRRRYQPGPDAPRGVQRVVRTGEAELVPEVALEQLLQVTSCDAHRALLEELGMRSYLIVPMVLRGEVMGAMTWMLAETPRNYGPADVEIAREIGHRAAQAIENARLFEASEESTRRKDQFIAMLGHELRNPLAPIRTALDVMKLHGSSELERERAVIERQVAHVGRLVDDLLDVTRVTTGKVQLTLIPLPVREVLDQAVEMVEQLVEQRAHTLRVEVEDEQLGVVGDPTRLAQVVANLLANAAKYTEPGGRLSLRAVRVGERVEIEVADNGLGIDPALLPRLFELFSQSPQSLDRAQGGLGLGLALAKSLVELHQGSISAFSEGPGRGSRFVVNLPACDAWDAAKTLPLHAMRRTDATAPQGEGETILVVDDNEDAREMIALGLMKAGYHVETAHDGPSALAVAAHCRPAAVLLDIGLPVMDGYEAAQRLRSMLGSAVRLIALSGYGTEEDTRRSRACGFEEHLVKPVGLETVLKHLHAKQG